MARMLGEDGYQVNVFLFNIHNKLSADCASNKKRLIESKRAKQFTEVSVNFDPPQLEAGMLVVDGLFGCGLNKPLAGGFASLVKYINQSAAKVVSIDLPSEQARTMRARCITGQAKSAEGRGLRTEYRRTGMRSSNRGNRHGKR